MKSFLLLILYLAAIGIFHFPKAAGQDINNEESLPADSTRPVPGSGEKIYIDTSLVHRPTKPVIPSETYYNFNDTVSQRLLIDRFNLYDQTVQSFGHDAGDFLRSQSSNLIIENQSTPGRKTVSPDALPGDRMNVIFNDRSLNPLEHLPEPDNQIDFDDIPAGQMQRIYNMEGPLGAVLDGENMTSSLIMIPHRPDTFGVESRLVVDKGSFGYANTKALFTSRSITGQSMRAALEYRKATGGYTGRSDDAYHQWGEFIYPLNPKIRLNLSGRLYRRLGDYAQRPDTTAFVFRHDRRDRDLTAGFDFYQSPEATTSIEFRHQRSESKLDRAWTTYNRNMDVIHNELTGSHDFRFGSAAMKLSASAADESFIVSGSKHSRHRGNAELKSILGDSVRSFVALAKLEKVGGFNMAPSAALVLAENHPALYWSASIGYKTKFPRQYELDLPSRTARIIDSTQIDYYESGNPALKPEKQLVGNFTFGRGQVGSDLTATITGGKIFDGIDWQRTRIDSSGLALNVFKAGNQDINFATATIQQRFIWKKRLRWSGSGSYHYVEVNHDNDPPYAPKYQLVSGLELYQYVNFLDLHLYGYLEAIYNGRYHGYLDQPLGENPVINLKLSFRIKEFRFYYIFQDVTSLEYQSREDYTISGRYNYWGLTWNFLD